MMLAPRTWIWNGMPPDPGWLAGFPSAEPAVWMASLPDDANMEQALRSSLSAEEGRHFARLHLRDDQRRFLTGRGLLRWLLGAHLHLPPDRVVFGYGTFGKPFLVCPAGASGLHFNMSHSAGLVLLAFHPTLEIGVDVEEMRPFGDLERLAKEILPIDEYQVWLRLAPAEQLIEFYGRWTVREAGLKATGTGLVGNGDSRAGLVEHSFTLALPAGYAGSLVCVQRPS